MTRSATISSQGQITVPAEGRDRLGLKTGDRVEFVVDKGKTVLRPARAPETPFLKFVGALPSFSNAKEINAWIVSLRDEEVSRRAGNKRGKRVRRRPRKP